jgi:hypothetical protein
MTRLHHVFGLALASLLLVAGSTGASAGGESGVGRLRCAVSVGMFASDCGGLFANQNTHAIGLTEVSSVNFTVSWQAATPLATRLQIYLVDDGSCADGECRALTTLGESPLTLMMKPSSPSTELRALVRLPDQCASDDLVEAGSWNCEANPVSVAIDQSYSYAWSWE